MYHHVQKAMVSVIFLVLREKIQTVRQTVIEIEVNVLVLFQENTVMLHNVMLSVKIVEMMEHVMKTVQ